LPAGGLEEFAGGASGDVADATGERPTVATRHPPVSPPIDDFSEADCRRPAKW